MKASTRVALPLVGSIALLLAPAHAVDVIKANNADALNLTTSWTGGALPGINDVVVWDATSLIAGALATQPQLGADASWFGIRIGDVPGAANAATTMVGIQNAGSANTLTIGAGGIDMSAATKTLRIDSRITIGASQTWNITNANTAGNPAGFNNNEDLAFQSNAAAAPFNLGGNTVTTTGTGQTTITSGYTITNGTFNIGNNAFLIQGGANRTTTVGADVTLNVANGSRLRYASQSAPNAATPSLIVDGTTNLAAGSTLELFMNQARILNITGGINANGSTTIQVTGAQIAALTHSGALAGPGAIAYQNINTNATPTFLDLSGNNSGYTGTLTLNGASGARILRLSGASSGSAAATWSVGAANTLQIHGVSVDLGTLDGTGTITNSSVASTAVVNAGAGTFAGALTDGALPMELTKVGAGTLTLTGFNTYSGATAVNAGTLIATPGALSATTPVTIAANATFGTRITAAGTALSIGTLTSSGTIAVDLGTLANPAFAPLVVGNLTVQAASRLRITGSGLSVGNFPVLDYTGAIGGLGLGGITLVLPQRVIGTLMDDGSTQLVVNITGFDLPKWTGAVDGKWDIDDGTGTGTLNWVELNNGGMTRYLQNANGADTARFDDTATGTKDVDLTTTLQPTGIIVDNTTATYTFGGTGRISGTATLTKSGTGTLRIRNAGTNDFTGGVTINAGAIELGDGVTPGLGTLGTGAITNNGTLIFNRPDAFTLTPAISGTGGLTQNGAGTVTIAGLATPGGPIVLNLGNLSFSGGGNLSGAVSGAGGIIVAGGTLQLSGLDANTYAGVTNVTGGVLQLNKSGVIAVPGNITLTGNGSLALLQAEQIANTATLIHNATVTTRMANETIAAAVVSPVTTGDAAQLIADNGLNITGMVTLTAGAYATASNTTISNAGGVTMSGGFLRVAANGGPSTLTVGAMGISASGGVIEVGQGVGLFDAILNLNGDFSATTNMEVNRGGLLSGARREINFGAAPRTFTIAAGTTTNLRPDLAGDGGLVKAGAGVLDLLGTPAYFGATVVSAGTLRTSTAQTGTSSISVQDAAHLYLRIGSPAATLTTPSVTLGTTTGANLSFDLGTFGNPSVAPVTTTSLTTSAGSKLIVIGAVSPGVFPLIDYTDPLGGAGFAGLTLQLPLRVAGSLQHDMGNTLINVNILGTDTPKWNGNLSANWDVDDGTGTGTENWRGSFSNAALRYLQGGGGTDAVIFDDSAASGTVTLTTTLTPTSLTVANATLNYTFAGAGKISGPTGLTKSGAGTLTLRNTTANDYTGPTLINEGVLQLGDGATVGAGTIGPAAITNSGALVLNRPDDFTLPNVINGSGTLVKTGPNNATLSAAVALFGPVTLNAGTLTFTGGGTLGGLISGAGALTSAGGTLLINGGVPNTNTGLTTVNTGILQLSDFGGNAVGGDIVIGGTGQLALLAPEQIPNTATVTLLGSSADSITTQSGETIGNVVVNSSVPGAPGGQVILRNFTTIAGTGTIQSGILAVASGNTGTINAVNIITPGTTAAILRIAGNSAGSTLNVGPGGITAAGGDIQVKFNTNDQDAILNLEGDFTATGDVIITNANYGGFSQNVINLTGQRTFDIAAGALVTVQPDFGGPGGLTKTGAGTLSIEPLSSGSYAGDTVISAGTLLVRGSLGGTTITANGGLLAGTGTLAPGIGGVDLNATARLAPGTDTTIGTLSVAGTLDLTDAVAAPATGALLFDLGDPFASDRVLFTLGALNIGTGLDFGDFLFSTQPGFADQNLYTLFDGNSPIAGALGPNRHGLVGGFAAQLFIGDNGNDLMLLIPEPGTAALLLAGLGVVGLRRRRNE